MTFISGVSEIRGALESISGALRYEPNPQTVERGDDLARAVPYTPRSRVIPTSALSPDSSFSLQSEDVTQPGEAAESLYEFCGDAELQDAVRTASNKYGAEIRQQELLTGVDAYGWYVTLHQRRYQWGIYIDLIAGAILAQNVFSPIGLDIRRALRLAFHAVLQHELMHFALDVTFAQLELALVKPFYWSASDTREQLAREDEECLANGYMLRRFRALPHALKYPGAYAALLKMTKAQPPGYRDGYALVGPAWNVASHGFIAGEAARTLRRPVLDHVDVHRLIPASPAVPWTHCPIHLMCREKRLAPILLDQLFIPAAPVAQETAKFRRSLAKLDPSIQVAWRGTKETLSTNPQSAGLDLKKWRPGGSNCWSVRVTHRHRAHLSWAFRPKAWIAEDIGNHKSMGHG